MSLFKVFNKNFKELIFNEFNEASGMQIGKKYFLSLSKMGLLTINHVSFIKFIIIPL
jgi:hypothetical protein